MGPLVVERAEQDLVLCVGAAPFPGVGGEWLPLPMAYDMELADRLRDLLVSTPTTEKKMFGGLAFLVGGHMAVAVSGQGGLMIRCAPEDTATHLTAGASPMVMHGKEMNGWLRVLAEDLGDDDALVSWVRIGVAQAESFPPKPPPVSSTSG